jgi:hypothetical protein
MRGTPHTQQKTGQYLVVVLKHAGHQHIASPPQQAAATLEAVYVCVCYICNCLQLLEGASVLLGPATCTALAHEAQQHIQLRLAEQDGCISGDGWFRLRAAYQRMNMLPGPELAMKLEAHS